MFAARRYLRLKERPTRTLGTCYATKKPDSHVLGEKGEACGFRPNSNQEIP